MRGISATPGTKKDYVALFSDPRLDMNTKSGKFLELPERVVQHREFIIQMLGLDRAQAFSVLPSADAGDEIEEIVCEVCKKQDADVDDPIILCDGEHDPPVGLHIRCAGIDHVPAGWVVRVNPNKEEILSQQQQNS